MNDLALWLDNRAEHGEAEPLCRRALAITEKSLGPEHPNVATGLNNLPELLSATNRLAEAEPLSRRHLRIFAEFGYRTGHEHPLFRAAISNYFYLLSVSDGLESSRNRGTRAVGDRGRAGAAIKRCIWPAKGKRAGVPPVPRSVCCTA
jgi:hypothetical protein